LRVMGVCCLERRWRRVESWERKALPTPPTPMTAMKMDFVAAIVVFAVEMYGCAD